MPLRRAVVHGHYAGAEKTLPEKIAVPRASLLRHVAAGLLQSFVSRNNDLGGYWAPGVLYIDADATCQTVRLNLLDGTAAPLTTNTAQAARNYSEFLRRALLKKQVSLSELAEAQVDIAFNVAPELCDPPYTSVGEPFICTVTLRAKGGTSASIAGAGRCQRNRPGYFSQRAP
jgi:hypothetical protein